MGKIIAVTGKGGTGKTAVTTMVMRVLLDAGVKPILAVDADPNSNFHATLGVEVEMTLGGVRESQLDQGGVIPPGMSKPEYFEYRTREALVEASGFDFLAMGRPEGPGCYCFANSMLRNALGRLEGGYDWVVVDCEAGLEHFSRRTASAIDLLIALSDTSRRGMDTIRTVMDLSASLDTPVKEAVVAVNMCETPPPDAVVAAAQQLGFQVAAYLPRDPQVTARDMAGDPLLNLPPTSALLQAVRDLLAGTRVVGPILAAAPA